MGYSGTTPHLLLPQFNDTDKPSWRGDINAAFNLIDEAVQGKADKSTIDYYVADYGAVGDGTTDDTAHIQAAIDDAFNHGGGNVHLMRNASCIFDGEITVKTGVTLVGSKVGQVLGVNDLKAGTLSSTLKVGSWTNGYSPSGVKDISVDGNRLGSIDPNNGLVYLESGDCLFENMQIRNAAGAGLYWNAIQNCVFLNLHINDCKRGLVIDNGSGGTLVLRAEISNNGKGVQFMDTPGMPNGYPFGSAQITFDTCIIEWYDNATNPLETLLDYQCGASVKFNSCGFSNNSAATPSSLNAQCLISNTPFPTISSNIEFSSCTWNGLALDAPIRVVGAQMVEVNGITYCDNQTPFLAVPVLSAPVVNSTGGTWSAGTKTARVTAVNANGETTPSAAQNIVTTGTTSDVILSWTAVPGAVSYNVYISDGANTYKTNVSGTTTTLTAEPTTVAIVPTANNAATPMTFYLQDSGVAAQVSLNFTAFITVGPVNLKGTINGGSTVNCYRQYHGLTAFINDDGSDWPLEGKFATDGAGVRWYIDGGGGLHWNDGSDYGNKASVTYDVADDQIIIAGRKVISSSEFEFGGPIETDTLVTNKAGRVTPKAPTIFAAGAITLDVAAYEVFEISVSGGGSVTGITVDNAVEGARMTIIVISDGNAQTFTWPANFFFTSGATPATSPTAGPAGAYCRTYEFIYDAASNHWLNTNNR